jgi:hypothetical protein
MVDILKISEEFAKKEYAKEDFEKYFNRFYLNETRDLLKAKHASQIKLGYN